MTHAQGLQRWGRVLVLALATMAADYARAHDVIPFENVTASSGTFPFGGLQREVLVLRPTVPAAGKLPAVVMLHYLRGRADDMADLIQAGKLVRDHGVVVILPEAVNGEWNYGSGSIIGLTTPLIDDVGFLSALITKSVNDYSLDATRIYMAGYSNGGLMTMRFACDHPEQIAAGGNVARVTMKSSDSKACKPKLPTPMLLVNGTADPVSTYDGTKLLGVTATLSAPATAAFWAKLDGCAATPVGSTLADAIADGTTVHLDTFSGCTALDEVDFYTVNGGGHTWPGSIGFSPGLGITSEDFDATSLLWSFFQRFSRH
ncbi:MAG: hypothetical protein JWR16_2072 [Nevskia sp.]|nr:hypothetical protein [Nevskia sp.]